MRRPSAATTMTAWARNPLCTRLAKRVRAGRPRSMTAGSIIASRFEVADETRGQLDRVVLPAIVRVDLEHVCDVQTGNRRVETRDRPRECRRDDRLGKGSGEAPALADPGSFEAPVQTAQAGPHAGGTPGRGGRSRPDEARPLPPLPRAENQLPPPRPEPEWSIQPPRTRSSRRAQRPAGSGRGRGRGSHRGGTPAPPSGN